MFGSTFLNKTCSYHQFHLFDYFRRNIFLRISVVIYAEMPKKTLQSNFYPINFAIKLILDKKMVLLFENHANLLNNIQRYTVVLEERGF